MQIFGEQETRQKSGENADFYVTRNQAEKLLKNFWKTQIFREQQTMQKKCWKNVDF